MVDMSEAYYGPKTVTLAHYLSTPARPLKERKPIPLRTRRAIYDRCDGRCEWPRGCDQPGLDLHHRHYSTQGEEWPEDLLLLCRKHHKEAHRDPDGRFRADPVELALLLPYLL